MNKLILIILVLVFISCRTEISKVEELPMNSATKLINENEIYNEISKPSAKNIDVINGFRGLKLMTNMDSLYLNDWSLIKFSNEIDYFEKSTNVKFQDKMYLGDICLTFYNDSLIMIDVNLKDIEVLENNEKFSMEDAEYEFIEPSLMNIFYNTFGEKEPYKLDKKIKTGPFMSLEELFKEPSERKKPEIDLSYSDYIMMKSPNETFVRNLYKVYEVKSRVKNDTQNNYDVPIASGTVIYHLIESKILYEYFGDDNSLKLLLTNRFEIFEPEGKTSFQYELKNVQLQIKIYKKEVVDNYLLAKNFEVKSGENKLKIKLNKESKLRDSIILMESSSEF